MAAQKKSKKGTRKSFYDVKVPLTAAKVQLYASAPEDLNGRSVKLDLTKSLRGKSFEMKVKIKASEDSIEGSPISLSLAGSFIRRMMRRGTDYVEDSFPAECRDFLVRVKPFLITRNRVSRAVRRSLREQAKKFLEGHMKTRNAQEIFTELMSNKLQKQLAVKLKKIYPLALCEIRVFEVTGIKEQKSESENSKE